jgi:hypothetical protein
VTGILLLAAVGTGSVVAQVEGGLGPSASSVAQAAFYYISKPGEITMSINLWGFVQKPGRYEVPISTDLVQLLSYAGGPIENANMSSVQVTRTERRDDAIRRLSFTLDLTSLHKLEPQALTLRPGDTIMIERVPFTWSDFLGVMTALAVVVTAVTSVLWWTSNAN